MARPTAGTPGTSDGGFRPWSLVRAALECPDGVLPDFDFDRGDRGDGQSHAALIVDAGGALPQAMAHLGRSPLRDSGQSHCCRHCWRSRGPFFAPVILDATVGVSTVLMALWPLKPDILNENASRVSRTSAFIATLIAFFIAEIGDKTQIATALHPV